MSNQPVINVAGPSNEMSNQSEVYDIDLNLASMQCEPIVDGPEDVDSSSAVVDGSTNTLLPTVLRDARLNVDDEDFNLCKTRNIVGLDETVAPSSVSKSVIECPDASTPLEEGGIPTFATNKG